jgi:cell division protein FtsW
MRLYADLQGAPTPPSFDRALVWSVLLLAALGLVMVYSASIATAEASRATGHDPAYYLMRQGAYLALAALAGALAFQVPPTLWQRAAPWLFLVGVVLLVLVLVPGIGREVNGSRRWLALPGVSVQPSEFVKLAVVLYAADYTVRRAAHMDSLRRGFLPMLAVMLLTGALLLAEPDFGAFAVITGVAMAILFLGGMNWRLFAGLFVMLVAGFVLLIWSSPYRMQRVLGFMDPWADPYGKGYQLSHALIAFGRGEWFGVGLGASIEKLFYLPEAHTDFLLAVVAEELGFAGVAAVIALFAWLILRAFAVARRATLNGQPFAALVAQGVGVWIALQALVNLGVNMGVLPTKGLTLPLMSYGGSSLVAVAAALGIVLRIDWENRRPAGGRATP